LPSISVTVPVFLSAGPAGLSSSSEQAANRRASNINAKAETLLVEQLHEFFISYPFAY